jgi:hypothetical protein
MKGRSYLFLMFHLENQSKAVGQDLHLSSTPHTLQECQIELHQQNI